MEPSDGLVDATSDAAPIASVLPNPSTPIVGRRAEVTLIRRLLDSGHRVVTLTGPGGVGKTRVALEVAAGADVPTLFVGLSGITDAVAALPAIVRTAGWIASEEQPTLDTIREELGDRPALIVLDTAEHLPGLAGEVENLLECCPSVAVLITSRVATRVVGERIASIEPLDVPGPVADMTVAEARSIDSVALLLQTIDRYSPSFELTAANLDAVVSICRRLDGLPLAIELAASRLRLVAPDQLASLLAQPLDVLASRDQPDHHRTLRATIDWSAQLLEADDRERFIALAVFPSSFDVPAAAAVVGVEVAALLDTFETLVDHHLVRSALDLGPGGPRFALLDAVRAYASEQLDASGATADRRAAHARWCADVASRAAGELEGPGAAEAVARLDAEYDSLDAAMEWLALEAEHGDETCTEVLLELVGSLWRYWWFRGRARAGAEWIHRAITLAGDRRSSARARAVHVAGELAEQLGDLPAAEARFLEAAELWLELGDEVGAAEAWNGVGMVARTRGDFERASVHHDRARDVFARHGLRRREASALHHLAAIAYYGEDLDEAARLWSETLAILREVGDERARGVIVSNLGSLQIGRNDLVAATAAFEEAVEVAERIGDLAGLVAALNNTIDVRLLRGDLDGLDLLVERTRAAVSQSDFALAHAVLVHNEGRLAAQRGQLGDAAALLADGWTRFAALDAAANKANSLEQLGMLAAELGHHDTAAELLQGATGYRLLASEPLGPEASNIAHWTAVVERAVGHPLSTGDDALLTVDDVALSATITEFVAATANAVRSEPSRLAAVEVDRYGLTSREVEVAELLVERRTDQEIADALFLSRRTVTTHVSAILRKLGVPSRRDVATALAPPSN